MDSKILLGVIAVTIFGTLALQSMMAQAGVFPIETMEESGPVVFVTPATGSLSSSATCPVTHPFLIGGSYFFDSNSNTAFAIDPTFDTATNTYTVTGGVTEGSMNIQANALCANFNFPMNMGMIGGELLDIHTVSLLVGAIGVNPVITALVGITIAGVAGQAVWFVHRRKKNNS